MTQGGDVIERINFKLPFASPPKVFAVLSGFSLAGDNHWDIRVFANSVDSRGFTINIIKTRESRGLGNGQVHWIAFPEGGIPGMKMCCGDLRSKDGTHITSTSPSYGHVDFDGMGFAKTPHIFLALSQFDAQSSKNLRIDLPSSNVTATGMDWRISTWGDTKIYSATASYLALEH